MIRTNTKMKKALLAVVATVALSTGFVACSSGTPACATETVYVKSGGSSSGGGSRSGSGSRSSGGGSGAKPAPPKSGSSGKSGGPSSRSKSPSSPSQKAAAKNSKPNSKPDAASVAAAKDTKPATVSRGGTYVSSVTNRTYVFHSSAYYLHPGYIWDIYDIYNPYNYWYMRTSPFYGMPYRVAASCGGPEREVKPDVNNINITVDNDGKVTQAEDKNDLPAELKDKAETDDQPDPKDEPDVEDTTGTGQP